jgi:drug/metabolite transporter (DMT)-like permease
VRFPDKKDLPRIALLGLTGMFGNQFFFILGLSWTNSTIASAVNQFQPIAASMMAIVIGLERFLWLKLLGVVVCVSGALLMIGLDNLEAGGNTVVWHVLPLWFESAFTILLSELDDFSRAVDVY